MAAHAYVHDTELVGRGGNQPTDQQRKRGGGGKAAKRAKKVNDTSPGLNHYGTGKKEARALNKHPAGLDETARKPRARTHALEQKNKKETRQET